MRREITPTQIANAIRDLIDEKEQLEDQIMNEITEFCRDCESCQCCPEEDCILFRIERIIEGEEYERGTTKAS